MRLFEFHCSLINDITNVHVKYRKVLGIGIGFYGDTDTLKLTRYPILRVLGIGFVPSLPVIYLGNSICEFIKEVKHLGVMIHSSMKTTIDVARQTRKFYLQANLLLRNFRHCSDQVKCVLFQTYCTNLNCCQLCFNSTKSSLKKLSTSYNSVLRRLGICKPYSASKLFVSRGIPTFAELLRTSIYRFAQRIEHSSNCIISATLLPLKYISSPIRKWWNFILYVK